MISFHDWLVQRESTAATRARAAAARGLLPPQVVGSVHGHSTAPPWEAEQLAKIMGRKRKHKKGTAKATANKKKVTPANRNTQIDGWLKEVDNLKDSLAKLKSIFDKKKETGKKEEPKVQPKKDQEKATQKPEKPDQEKEAKPEKPDKPAKDEKKPEPQNKEKPEDTETKKKPKKPDQSGIRGRS